MPAVRQPSQPSRIMPKRNSGRQNKPDETPDSSEQVPETSRTRTRTRSNVNSSVMKRKRNVDDSSQQTKKKNSASSRAKLKETDEDHSSSVDNAASGSRVSPDAHCSICLGAIENRAFTDSCYHTFCFGCLKEWSRVRAVCPLCKKSFGAIVHDFISYDDYQIYRLPHQRLQQDIDDNDENDSAGLVFSNPASFPVAGTFTYSSSLPVVLSSSVTFWPSQLENSYVQALAFRRRVYAEQLRLLGVWSPTRQIIPPGYVSPSLFACHPTLLNRVVPWILRELSVLVSDTTIGDIGEVVIDLLRRHPITSEEFYEQLFSHLGQNTRQFQQELDSFARSPYDMRLYDEMAIYDFPSAPRSTSNYVEAISSDDSDVEVTVPESDSRQPIHSVGVTTPFNYHSSGLFVRMTSVSSGWDSPVPGPSGIRFETPVQPSSFTDVNFETVNLSVTGDNHSTATVSDSESDIVVIESNIARQSPIMLSSSSDEDNDVKVVAECSSAGSGRNRRRRKNRRSSDACDHIVLQETDDTNKGLPETSGVVDMSLQTAAAAAVDDKQRRDRSQGNEKHQHTHHQHSSSKTGIGCELSSAVAGWSVRQKLIHNTSDAEDDLSKINLSEDTKMPTCKKHVSGHKSSSKRKMNVDTTNLEYSSVSKCEGAVSLKSDGSDDAVLTSSSSSGLDALQYKCDMSEDTKLVDECTAVRLDCVADMELSEKVEAPSADCVESVVTSLHGDGSKPAEIQQPTEKTVLAPESVDVDCRITRSQSPSLLKVPAAEQSQVVCDKTANKLSSVSMQLIDYVVAGLSDPECTFNRATSVDSVESPISKSEDRRVPEQSIANCLSTELLEVRKLFESFDASRLSQFLASEKQCQGEESSSGSTSGCQNQTDASVSVGETPVNLLPSTASNLSDEVMCKDVSAVVGLQAKKCERVGTDDHSYESDNAGIIQNRLFSSAAATNHRQKSPNKEELRGEVIVDGGTCSVLIDDEDDIDVQFSGPSPVHVILDSDNDDCLSVDCENLSETESVDTELEYVASSPPAAAAAACDQYLSELVRRPRCISLSSDDESCADDDNASDVEPIDLSSAHQDEEAEHSQQLPASDDRCNDVMLGHSNKVLCQENAAQNSGHDITEQLVGCNEELSQPPLPCSVAASVQVQVQVSNDEADDTFALEKETLCCTESVTDNEMVMDGTNK